MKERYYFIDIVRAISILGVIIIHTYSYHLTSSINFFIWNSLQFVVISFVFCAGYVTKPFHDFTFIIILQWLRKRLSRLYIPFLMYFIIHYSLFLFFPHIFHNLGMQRSVPYIASSILMIGGLNTGWLPLLFVELAFITPLLFFLEKKRLLYFYIFFGVIFTFSLTFVLHFPYSYYRWVMWIPWSLVFLMGWYMKENNHNNLPFLAMGIISALGVFSISYYFLFLRHQLIFYDNKYPPNLYYLSYGLLGTYVLIILAKVLEKVIFMRAAWVYLSSISYTLFFVHFIVLDIFELLRLNNILLESLFVMAGSVVLIAIGQFTFQHKQLFVRNNS